MDKIIEKQIGDYLWWCEKVRGMSPVTVATKRNVMMRFARVTEIGGVEKLTNEAFNDFVEYEIQRGASARSVNMYNSVVVAMVRYYREMGMKVPVNLSLVMKLKETRTERKYYTAEEVEQVIEVARSVGDEVSALQIKLLFETGMRIAELTWLKVSDFDEASGCRVRFVGKGRRLREVYLRRETYGAVMAYAARYGIPGGGYLWCVGENGFVTLNGEPPVVNTVRLRLRRVFEMAGFSGFYPHALRHSFATDLQVRGASVAEIKEMIGHSSTATTERYLHGFEGRTRELWERWR